MSAQAQAADIKQQHKPMRFAELEGKIGTRMLHALARRRFGYETI